MGIDGASERLVDRRSPDAELERQGGNILRSDDVAKSADCFCRVASKSFIQTCGDGIGAVHARFGRNASPYVHRCKHLQNPAELGVDSAAKSPVESVATQAGVPRQDLHVLGLHDDAQRGSCL